MTMLEAKSLQGVLVALLTPIADDGTVDRDAAARLAADLLDRGVWGICPAGTTGEGASLSLLERLSLVDAIVAAVPPSTPVVPGVFQDAFLDVQREIEAYAEHGASAVLLAPPHYYVLPPQDLRRYYEEAADSSPLPLIVYNIPGFTKNQVPPSALVAVAAHPRVVGVKDSSRDMEYLLGVLDGLEEAGIGPDRFAVTTGTDTMLLASLAAGAQGAIVASANVAPELSCGAFAAWRAADREEAHSLEARLRRLVAACRLGSYPAGWKAAAAAQGACRPWMVRPRQPLDEPSRTTLVEALGSLDLLGARS